MKRYLILFIIILIIGTLISILPSIYLPYLPSSEKEVIFDIEKGESSREIAINLEKADLIRWAPIFRTYVCLKGVAGKLQAGEYLLSPSMNISEIVKKFVSGDVIKEKITIIEGWSLKDIASYLEEKGISQSDEFLELTEKDFSGEFEFLKDKPKNLGLEGYLFPDTYEIRKGESLEDIVKKMLQNFDKKIAPYRDEISDAGLTVFDVITMASIIEKEVNTLEDKEIVSGIFWKRIEAKMPLQSCATIAYIKGVNQWQYSYEDTRIKSPYNTYLNRGLPLGPISNPGLDSIRAAISPIKTDYNYFLTDPATGKAIFSKTYEEHNINKSKYLK